MPAIEKIKSLLSIVVMVCFFLPLSQCTSNKEPVNQSTVGEQNIAPCDFVPYEQIHFQEISEIVLATVFAWPLVALIIRNGFHASPKPVVVNAGELILSAASMCYLFSIILFWGEIRYGGVIVLLCFVGYFIVSGLVVGRHVNHVIRRMVHVPWEKER